MKFRTFTTCSLFLIFAGTIFAQTPPAANQNSKNAGLGSRVYFPFRKKPSKEQRQILQPQAGDAALYAQVLAQPRTGIFRLLPDSGCEANTLVIRADEKCLNQIPDSSFFSFRENEHTQEILSDIRLKNGHLISDGILSQGILVNLGDARLEGVTTDTEGLKFLNEYEPQSTNRGAYKQFLQMANGVESGGYIYRKMSPVIENSTYALRVIAYKGNIFRTFRGFHFDLLAGDKRIDQTLAFRVVRKDPDGAVTIVWRELARREAPRIKFERKKTR
ncbi:MAG TPA: hypothetical protein VF692_00945 [Pyrinomonadaceae bacterium]